MKAKEGAPARVALACRPAGASLARQLVFREVAADFRRIPGRRALGWGESSHHLCTAQVCDDGARSSITWCCSWISPSVHGATTVCMCWWPRSIFACLAGVLMTLTGECSPHATLGRTDSSPGG